MVRVEGKARGSVAELGLAEGGAEGLMARSGVGDGGGWSGRSGEEGRNERVSGGNTSTAAVERRGGRAGGRGEGRMGEEGRFGLPGAALVGPIAWRRCTWRSLRAAGSVTDGEEPSDAAASPR